MVGKKSVLNDIEDLKIEQVRQESEIQEVKGLAQIISSGNTDISIARSYLVSKDEPAKILDINGSAISHGRAVLILAHVAITNNPKARALVLASSENNGAWIVSEIVVGDKLSNEPEIFIDADQQLSVRLWGQTAPDFVDITILTA